MSGATVADFLAYWEAEGERYARHGDYEWMAGLVPGRRVLEIGCGPGFSTQALAARGLAVLAVGGDALALEIAQVGADGLALHALQLDHPRLDDDAAGPVAHAAGPGLSRRRLPAAMAFEGSRRLAPAAPRIEAPGRLALAP